MRNLDLLLKKDLIEEIPGPTKRNQLVRLTALGAHTWEKGHKIWKQVQKETERLLGEEDLESLKRLCDCIQILEDQKEG